MNRRGFLKAFGAAVAAAAAVEIDPERLLWVPGAKTFFIPEKVAPKNLIIDPVQVKEQYEAAVTQSFDKERFKALTQGKFEAHTALGRAEFDAEWNLLRLSGREIKSAREAARLQATHYTRQGDIQLSKAQFEEHVARIAGKRAAAGLNDNPDVPPKHDWTRYLG